MPNNIINIIKVVDGNFQAVCNLMKSEECDFDFNKLIPMPQSMVALMTKNYGISNLSELGFKYWSAQTKADKYALIAEIKAKDCDLRNTLKEGLDRYLAYKDCGHWNSLEWAVANWGTKWNAFDADVNPSDRTIFFNSAWSAPIPIYKALAKQFPTHKISVKYYDEGGWFAGYCNIEDGKAYGEDYDCESAKGEAIINEIKKYMMTTKQKAAAWDKASALAEEATKTSRATYEEVRQACIDMSKWQAKQDKLMLDAKDESIVQLEMSMFERICHVCKYRCAKIGGTYKCANGKSFGESCDKKNCTIIK